MKIKLTILFAILAIHTIAAAQNTDTPITDSVSAAGILARQKAIQDFTLLNLDAQAAQAELATNRQEQNVRTQLPIATADAMRWMFDPQYQTSFAKAKREAKQHFIDAYPEISPQIPQIWNKALSDMTGKVAGTHNAAVETGFDQTTTTPLENDKDSQSQPESFALNNPKATEIAPTQFSTRTEAAVALWNKSNSVPATNEFRIAMQAFENAAIAFQRASVEFAPDAVSQAAVAGPKISASLSAYKQTALEMLAAIRTYKQAEKAELKLGSFSQEQQNQVLQKQANSFRLFEEWGAAAVQAADAGLTLRSLIQSGSPSEKARLHFIETWNASRAFQESFVERAQKHQNYTDELLRK